MRDEPVQLHERPGVEQHVESLPGGHLALFVLRNDTPGAAAELGFGALLLQQLQLLAHGHGRKSRHLGAQTDRETPSRRCAEWTPRKKWPGDASPDHFHLISTQRLGGYASASPSFFATSCTSSFGHPVAASTIRWWIGSTSSTLSSTACPSFTASPGFWMSGIPS